MNEDLLRRAAEVVRERYDGESELAAQTELRALSAFARQKRRARRAPLIAIPLVAALVGSAAWGIGGGRLRALVHRDRPASAAVPSIRPGRAGSRPLAPVPEMPGTTSAEPVAPVEAPALPETSKPVGSLIPSVHPVQRAPAVTDVPSTPTQPAESAAAALSQSEISTLYRAAHRAQFSGGDPNQALLLWDRYLAAAPNGALSPEARYNRAITLARLGRKAEAALALEPFARGDYGDYRKTEAASLLAVLRPTTAPVP